MLSTKAHARALDEALLSEAVSKQTQTGSRAQTKEAGLMTFPKVTIGLDVGDHYSHYSVWMMRVNEVIEEGRLPPTTTEPRPAAVPIRL